MLKIQVFSNRIFSGSSLPLIMFENVFMISTTREIQMGFRDDKKGFCLLTLFFETPICISFFFKKKYSVQHLPADQPASTFFPFCFLLSLHIASLIFLLFMYLLPYTVNTPLQSLQKKQHNSFPKTARDFCRQTQKMLCRRMSFNVDSLSSSSKAIASAHSVT